MEERLIIDSITYLTGYLHKMFCFSNTLLNGMVTILMGSYDLIVLVAVKFVLEIWCRVDELLVKLLILNVYD